jgi:hypothetical protein
LVSISAELHKTIIFVPDTFIMKKILTFFIALTFLACSDGDFDVPEFEFTETVYSCDEYLLYVMSSEKTEAMSISLLNGQLGKTVGEATFPVSSNVSIIYRIFDQGISTDYYCQIIPPTSPKVTNQLNAESGKVQIITSEVLKNNVVTGYSYNITILDLLFLDGNERIFYETFPIGTFKINI